VSGLKKGLFGLLKVIAAIALLIGGAAMHDCGFDRIRSMREVERVPATEAVAALEGEINLSGQVERVEGGKILRSPDTKSPCVYYHYTIERQERDSEGNTRWVTEHSESRWVPFALADASGRILVEPSRQVDFEVDRDHQRRSGDRRYTEYRLDAGDQLFCFGYVEKSDRALEVSGHEYLVRFQRPGAYSPILSQSGEEGERTGMALGSIFITWGGLVMLAIAVLLGCSLLRVHWVVTFLAVMTLALTGCLVFFGLNMMQFDLTSAHDRLARHRVSALEAVQETLRYEGGPAIEGLGQVGDLDGIEYEDMDESARRRIRRIRIDLQRSIQRTNKWRNKFPERFLAPLWGVGTEEALALPSADQLELDRLEASFVPASVSTWLLLALLAVGGLILYFGSRWGFRQLQDKRMIEHIPTSKTAGVAYGLAEVKGKVVLGEGQGFHRGPVSERECVWYHYTIRERRGSGKKAKWVTIHDEKKMSRFFCEDDHGRLMIDPTRCEIMSDHVTSRRSGNRIYREQSVYLGDPLFAIGPALIEPQEHVSLCMQHEEDEPLFLVSNLDEPTVMFRKARRGFVGLTIGMCCVILLTMLCFGALGSFQATDYLFSSASAPFYMAVMVTLLMYNDLIFLRNRVRRAWSNIDVSLKKRRDLIPNLEQVAKEYLKHEEGVHQTIARMRQGYGGGAVLDIGMATGLLGAEKNLLEMIMGLRENYPDLKGNEVIGNVMKNLTELENDVALMREGYNQSVERYNTRIQHFPELFLAGAFRFSEEEYFRPGSKVRKVQDLGLGA
jgi:hypothetical protein